MRAADMAEWDGFKDGYKCVLIARLLRCIRICLSLPVNFPGQIQLRARAMAVARVGESVPWEKSSRLDLAGGRGVPPGSGAAGLPAARTGVSRDAPCQGLPPFAFGVLLPRAGCRAFSPGTRFPSRSPPAKASLIYFQATHKGCFGVGSAGKKRLNRRCRDVFPHGEWWGNTEHVLNRREVITLLIFLCDLIKM